MCIHALSHVSLPASQPQTFGFELPAIRLVSAVYLSPTSAAHVPSSSSSHSCANPHLIDMLNAWPAGSIERVLLASTQAAGDRVDTAFVRFARHEEAFAALQLNGREIPGQKPL